MKIEKVQTSWARIYIAGDLDVAKQTCRKFCYEVGLCVTVTETDYIYTGGEEIGIIVELINYPRFPTTQEKLFATAKELAMKLMEDGYQQSFSIMTPTETTWFSRRKEDLKQIPQ